LMPLAASHSCMACAALPTRGFTSSGRSAPAWFSSWRGTRARTDDEGYHEHKGHHKHERLDAEGIADAMGEHGPRVPMTEPAATKTSTRMVSPSEPPS